MMKIGDGFEVAIPVARAVNPITKANWEGSGVSPDMAVPANLALATAHAAALEKLAENGSGDADEMRGALEKVRKDLEQLKYETN